MGQDTHRTTMKFAAPPLMQTIGVCFIVVTHNAISVQALASPCRRDVLTGMAATCGALIGNAQEANAAAAVQDSLNIDNFLRTGMDAGGNMGVSSQAGKSRPETGVVLRDGSDVSRNGRSGDVLAEILLATPDGGRMAALASYTSPWPLATGSFFDVECRDAKTGDGAFLAVTTNVDGRSIQDIPDAFFIDNLLAPTGRFSFYGQPTDVKIKRSTTRGDYRILEIGFSNLLQSTQTEIPRKAQLIATVPKGSAQAVMLIGSSTATRWKNKGVDQQVASIADSFRAIPAPQTSMKLRKKERASSLLPNYD